MPLSDSHEPCALVVEGFGWRHAGRKDPALVDINVTIPQGQKVLVLGNSGAGKSTLLAGIAGVLGDDEDGERTGHITVDGVDPRHQRGLVGMVLQDPDSQVIASHVGDDVVFGCENLGVPREEMWERAEEAVNLVRLNLPLDHPTSQLSGGQKQRLALAGVLAMRPKVLVLDEPTANLDPQGAADVRDAVIRAASATGATLIVVEHRVETWAEHMDRVIVLGAASDGLRPNSARVEGASELGATVVADGPADTILEQHADYLASAGMWVPGVPLDLISLEPQSAHSTNPPRSATGGLRQHAESERLLWGDALGVGWDRELHSNLNVTLHDGSTVLTGHNGAGKTTLALTLGGLLKPTSGTVEMRGYRGQPHKWRSKQLVTRIGHVFQDPEHQFMARTVRDELLLGPKLAGLPVEQATAAVDQLLDSLRLRRLERANPFTLSGGEKRRLSVATMLATSPDLLIIDEPTFGQDRATFTAMVRLLQGLVERGVSLLSISHDANYTQLMAQHQLRLTSEGATAQ